MNTSHKTFYGSESSLLPL